MPQLNRLLANYSQFYAFSSLFYSFFFRFFKLIAVRLQQLKHWVRFVCFLPTFKILVMYLLWLKDLCYWIVANRSEEFSLTLSSLETLLYEANSEHQFCLFSDLCQKLGLVDDLQRIWGNESRQQVRRTNESGHRTMPLALDFHLAQMLSSFKFIYYEQQQ